MPITMEQEVRNNDIITMLANIMESQPHAIQNSQSNNNNSNPVPALRNGVLSRSVATSQDSTIPSNSQVEAQTTQNSNSTMNAHIMDISNQATVAGGNNVNSTVSEAEFAEIERISSTFIHPSFPAAHCTVSNSVSGETLMYDGSNHVNMVEVGNVLDTRIPTYPSNSLDFSQNQAILEALNSIEKDAFADGSGVTAASSLPCLRSEPAQTFAQSFVSMLQQQQMDTCNNLWPMNPVQSGSSGTNSFSGTVVNNKQTVTNANSAQATSGTDGHSVASLNAQLSSSLLASDRLETVSHPHLMYSEPASKSTQLMQHAPRSVSSGKTNITNQHYVHNDVQQYNSGKLGSKNRNDLDLPIHKSIVPGDDNPMEDRSKEVKLTTTPIPSDAEKSSGSCSSSSSGSVSGPEQSPDHTIDRTGSSRVKLSRQEIEKDLIGSVKQRQTVPQGDDPRHHQNLGKNYPCYNNMNMLNFGTINFSPVMDSSQAMAGGEIRKNQLVHDMNIPVPTSDSVVEIDETVTSVFENIPVSPPTPNADQGDAQSPPKLGSSYEDLTLTKMTNSNAMLPHKQTIATIQTCSLQENPAMVDAGNYPRPPTSRKPNSKKSDPSKKAVNGQKQRETVDSNNNSCSYIPRGKIGEKQKKPRNSKHPRLNHKHKDSCLQNDESKEGADRVTFNSGNINSSTMAVDLASNPKPKVNADPTMRKNFSGDQNSLANLQPQPQHGGITNGGFPTQNFNRLNHSSQNAFGRTQPINTCITAHAKKTNQSLPPHNAAARRQWQTVTAVQGPKLPPMLSEKDRIPKRGRPSKKMMQENLKIKNNNSSVANTNSPTVSAAPAKAPTQKVTQPIPAPAKLVSMYTINDKGFMEEIAPKLKENRRSKERTQAFLKMLAQIKSASKQQMAMNPKFGEKAKPGSEKQVKKRAKPRTKVFGRQVSEPLTESGITETMYTFSALAHQYKISSSIVERATENLLKSAAVKRSKEQSSTNAVPLERQRIAEKNNKKGVPVTHCENKTNALSSKAVTPTIRLPSASFKTEKSDGAAVLAKNYQVSSVSTVAANVVTLSSPSHAPQNSNDHVIQRQNAEIENTQKEATLALPVLPEPITHETTSEDLTSKTKSKKKKHKKHKKHKYADSKGGSSGKKKKKKKSKKKLKTKAQGAIPSSSVSVMKPPSKSHMVQDNVNGLDEPPGKMNTNGNAPKLSVSNSTTQDVNDNFSSGFRQNSDVNDSLSAWQPEDNAYDGEDSSSDEASASPKPYIEASEKQTTSSASQNLASFAQYSNSPLGFGMFSNQKQIPRSEVRKDNQPKTVTIPENHDQSNAFASTGTVRPKKHHKHKRRKFPRKSKNICDPAFLVHLDEILVNMRKLALDSTAEHGQLMLSQSNANIFFATSANESRDESLWKAPPATIATTQKNDQQAGIVKGAAFRSDSLQSGTRGGKPNSDFSTNIGRSQLSTFSGSSSACAFNNGNTLSVFCSSPFFQKYGYVSKLSQKSSVARMVSSTHQLTTTGQSVSQPKPCSAPCISTNALSTVPNTTEKIQETKSPPQQHLEPDVSKAAKQEKRKRGWPRGKPRGPRAKKAKVTNARQSSVAGRSISLPSSTGSPGTSKTSVSALNVSNEKVEHSKSNAHQRSCVQGVDEGPQATITSGAEFSHVSLDAKNEFPEKSNIPAVGGAGKNADSDLSKLVSESLLSQIKQAIENSLPAHPSVNKDAITKSVDTAVQNYLEKIGQTLQDPVGSSSMTSPSSEEVAAKKRPGKRGVRTKNSLENMSGSLAQSNGDSFVSTNVDKHPKKVWACKHHDDEVLSPVNHPYSTDGDSGTFTPQPVLMKKRGPGRPRKNPLVGPNLPSAPPQKNMKVKKVMMARASVVPRHGKVPTASATVVPVGRKISAVRMQGMSFRRKMPAVRMQGKISKPIGRPRSSSLITGGKIALSGAANPHATITRNQAISSVEAFMSAKALRSKSKAATFDTVVEPGLYTGTSVEEHMVESIHDTVEKYSWDNYKKLEEACLKVEKEMGFSEENENMSGDSKRRVSIPKKSIESVVEKLKNKQAQNMHTAATALLQLHDIQTHTNIDDFEDSNVLVKSDCAPEQETTPVQGRRQDIYEKVLATTKSLHHNTVKVKKQQRLSVPVKDTPLKRPRGRPRKHPLPDQGTPELNTSPKRPRTHSSEFKQPRLWKDKSPINIPKGVNKKQNLKFKENGNSVLQPTNESLDNSDSSTLPSKPYLEAGLYSSTFKKDSESSTKRSDEDANVTNTIAAKLPPPFDAGLYLRSTLKDFQLPYNIWWMYKHHKISASQDPSTHYIEITRNVYTNPRPASNLGDHICTCKPVDGSPGCGKQCLNRLMYFECMPSSCPCGNSCSNQTIQKAQWCTTLKRFKTDKKGWGIRTTDAILEGSFILEYVGEVMSEAEFKVRTVELYHAYNDHYCVQLDTYTVIDGYRMANEGRFVNHSCDPNCEMQKWCVNGEYRIGLFALREIKADEELTYDYNFHAYNIDQQQVCRCGSQKCRGIIGGRTQRSPSGELEASNSCLPAGPTKLSKGKQSKLRKTERIDGGYTLKDDELGTKEFSILQMKPLTLHETEVIRLRQLFLVRNLAQVRRKEEQQQKTVTKRTGDSDTARYIKTNHKTKLKKTQQSKEESKKIENALTQMYTAIATCKDQNGVSVAIPFMNLPSKKKNPEYYERISNPIDLSIIERNIMSNHYKDIETFNSDVQRVFRNAEKYHGRKSTLGKDVIRLRKAYANARGKVTLLMNGHKKPGKTREVVNEDLDEGNDNIHRKNEDHIRCICCIYKDEGLMVQCEKCYVWQHCDCMGVKPGNTDRYLCEECDPRPVSREVRVIPPPPNTPPGHTYYVTLLRDNLLVKQGDSAYLMRDHRLRHNNNVSSVRALHRNLANISQENLDIFRIEKLWTDERGDKYAYGHHFLRPHETHHSPSRTFYPNELFASPFYEIIPLEAVVGLCIVMDVYTYCKGKPKGFKMSDIFICDFRIDKAAGIFTRINKKKYPICTKPHVFDTYKHRISPKKNFQPHQVPEHYKKASGRPAAKLDSFDADVLALESCDGQLSGDAEMVDENILDNEEDPDAHERQEDNGEDVFEGLGRGKWTKKRQRLEGIAHKLLSKLPKQAVDVSYLLEPGTGKRQRKKTLLSLESLSQQK